MPSKASDWVEIIRAIFAGLKDLALVAVSCYSIYLQAGVAGKQETIEAKVDTAAVKAEESASNANVAAVANLNTNRVLSAWKAETTLNPMDDKAAAAAEDMLEKFEKTANKP